MAIPVLECRALSKNYGSFTALSNFNLSLPAGRIIGLLGPNGSGKTSTYKDGGRDFSRPPTARYSSTDAPWESIQRR